MFLSQLKAATRFLPRPKAAWLQFSLRSMMLFVVVVCLALAWWLDRQELERRIEAIEQKFAPSSITGSFWGIEQVTGQPNTSGAGDIPTAWASSTQDGRKEWLLLTYAKRVRPTIVEIHETHNPGAVTKISMFDKKGKEVVVWQGTDPTPKTAARGVSKFPVEVDFATHRVKVYLDSPSFPGWNEIDAVGLRYSWGRTIWAESATASSIYGQGSFGGMTLTFPYSR